MIYHPQFSVKYKHKNERVNNFIFAQLRQILGTYNLVIMEEQEISKDYFAKDDVIHLLFHVKSNDYKFDDIIYGNNSTTTIRLIKFVLSVNKNCLRYVIELDKGNSGTRFGVAELDYYKTIPTIQELEQYRKKFILQSKIKESEEIVKQIKERLKEYKNV